MLKAIDNESLPVPSALCYSLRSLLRDPRDWGPARLVPDIPSDDRTTLLRS
jgi:hypothetical protein